MNRLLILLLLAGCMFFCLYPQATHASDSTLRSTSDSTKETASLTISSIPSEAEVSFDGSVIGKTPISMENILPGKHTVIVRKLGFVPYVDTLIVARNSILLREARLVAASSLTISSEPAEAEVFVNDTLVGKTPMTLTDISPGRIDVELRKYDFAPWKQKVNLIEGKNSDINARLVSKNGFLTLHVIPEDAEVFIDGKSVGRGSLKEYKLPYGKYDLIVTDSSSASDIRQSVFIGPGASVRLEAGFNQTTTKKVLQSALVPGLGQITSGATLKGATYLAGFVTGGFLAITGHQDYGTKQKTYNEIHEQYSAAQTESEAKIMSEKLSHAFDEMNSAFNKRKLGIITAVSFYALSFLDALLFHSKENSITTLAVNSSTRIVPELTLSSGEIQCTLRISM